MNMINNIVYIMLSAQYLTNISDDRCVNFNPDKYYTLNYRKDLSRREIVLRYMFSPSSPFEDADKNVSCAIDYLNNNTNISDKSTRTKRLYAIIETYGLKIENYVKMIKYINEAYRNNRATKDDLKMVLQLGLGFTPNTHKNYPQKDQYMKESEEELQGDDEFIKHIEELRTGIPVSSLP